MIDEYKIKGTPEVYSIAVNCCQTGDLEFACTVHNDICKKGVVPDEAKNWQKALELYEDIKAKKAKPAVSMMNALITALYLKGRKWWNPWPKRVVPAFPNSCSSLLRSSNWSCSSFPRTTYSPRPEERKQKRALPPSHHYHGRELSRICPSISSSRGVPQPTRASESLMLASDVCDACVEYSDVGMEICTAKGMVLTLQH